GQIIALATGQESPLKCAAVPGGDTWMLLPYHVSIANQQAIRVDDGTGSAAAPPIFDLNQALAALFDDRGHLIIHLVNSGLHGWVNDPVHHRSPMVTLTDCTSPPRKICTGTFLPTRSPLNSASRSS